MESEFSAPSAEIAELKDINPRSGKKYSGFGVILDATRATPVSKSNGQETYVQLKVIDASMNPKTSEGPLSYIPLFIYQKSDSPYPFVEKIGDIIRFINFEFQDYNKQSQGKNRPAGSSWRIFHGQEDADTNDYCRSYNAIQRNDQTLVDQLCKARKWATTFFQKYSRNFTLIFS